MDTKTTELVTAGSRLHKIHRRSSDAFLTDQAMAEYRNWSDEIRRREAFLDGSIKIRWFAAAIAVGTIAWMLAIHAAGAWLAPLAHFFHIF